MKGTGLPPNTGSRKQNTKKKRRKQRHPQGGEGQPLYFAPLLLWAGAAFPSLLWVFFVSDRGTGTTIEILFRKVNKLIKTNHFKQENWNDTGHSIHLKILYMMREKKLGLVNSPFPFRTPTDLAVQPTGQEVGDIVRVSMPRMPFVRGSRALFFLCKTPWLHVKQEHITRKSVTGKIKEGQGKTSAPPSHLQPKRRRPFISTRAGDPCLPKTHKPGNLNELNFFSLLYHCDTVSTVNTATLNFPCGNSRATRASSQSSRPRDRFA